MARIKYYNTSTGQWEYADKAYSAVSGSGGTSGPVSWNDLTDKPFGETGEVLYEWNNTTEYDEVVTVDGGQLVKISNEPISSEEIVGKYLRMQGVVDGEIVVYDGAIEANMLIMFSEEFYSVNIDLPFVFVLAESIEAAEVSLTRGVWVQYDAAVVDVIAKIQIMNAPTDIDESYIPDTIARIADVEAMAKSVSWKNLLDKPFEVGAVYEYDENTTYSNEDHIVAPVGGFFENSGTDNDGPPWYIRVSNDALPLERFIGSNLILTSRDGSSDLEGTIAKNNVTEITEGVYTFNGIIIVVNVDEYYNTGTTFTRGIYCGGGSKYYTYPFTRMQISVPAITIEEEIIPDTIARVSDVQDMIDTALGVIENGSY